LLAIPANDHGRRFRINGGVANFPPADRPQETGAVGGLSAQGDLPLNSGIDARHDEERLSERQVGMAALIHSTRISLIPMPVSKSSASFSPAIR
jgi:hypothetical protein